MENIFNHFLMRDIKSESKQCIKKDVTIRNFYPAFAIALARNKVACDMLRRKGLCMPVDEPVRNSLLGGYLPNQELSNYKMVYDYLMQAEYDENAKNNLETIFGEQIHVCQEAVQSITVNNIFDILCLWDVESIYQDNPDVCMLCIGLAVYNGYTIMCPDELRNILFGFYLNLFSFDCDIDKDFSAFFEISNAHVLRKYLLKNFLSQEDAWNAMKKEYSAEDRNMQLPSLSFDVIAMMEDYLPRIVIANGFNPHDLLSSRNAQKLAFLDNINRLYTVQDKWKVSENDRLIIRMLLSDFSCVLSDIAEQQKKERAKYAADTPPMHYIYPAANTTESTIDESVTIDILKKQMQELREKNRELIDRMNQNKESVNTQEREHRKMEAEYEKLKKENEELKRKLSLMMESNEKKTNDNELTDEMLMFLRETHGIIVGGHTNLIKKLLVYLPNWKSIEPAVSTRNSWDTLINSPNIIMHTDYVSHNVYLKALDILPKKNHILFTQKNNVKSLLFELYGRLTKE